MSKSAGPRRVPETGVRGSDDFRMLTQQCEERRVGLDRIQAVQQQHGIARAGAQDLQLNAANCELLHTHTRSLIRIASRHPALIAADIRR